MKTYSVKEKTIAGIAAVILLSAVIASAYYISTNSSLKSGLNSERLKSESLLSEKLALDKEINQLKEDISSLSGKNAQTDKLLVEAQIQLEEKEKVMAGLRKENATTKNLKKELAEIKEMKENLLRQVEALNSQNKTLAAENQQLQKTTAQLKEEKNDLLKQIEFARAESLQKADNYQVDVLKNVKKDKLTYKAKRMKMMSVIIDVPKDLMKDISFTITTPDGKIINEKDKSLTWKKVNDTEYLLASLTPFNNDFTVTHQIKLNYTPSSKMKAGIYKIGILNSDKNIGNCRVHLK